MANTIDLKNLSLNLEFQDRVKYNLIFESEQVIGESNTVENTEIRQKHAVSILNNPDLYVQRYSQALSVLAGIAQSISITDSNNPVNSGLAYNGGQSPTSEFDEMDVEIRSQISTNVFNKMAGIINI